MQFCVMNSSYNELILVEDYESLIWTERYFGNGDFVLKSFEIEKHLSLLYLGAKVTHFDTLEVCIVETHFIEQNEDGVKQLTVTGRTMERFWENRTTIPAFPLGSGLSPILEPGTNDTNAIQGIGLTSIGMAASAMDMFNLDSRDNIPEHICEHIVAYWASLFPSGTHFMDRDVVSEYVDRILTGLNVGIRNDRNLGAGIGYPFETHMYVGVDRSSTVIFDVAAGHFEPETIKYLWSTRDYKNVVYVASQRKFVQVVSPEATAYTGFDRRVGLLELPEITQTGADVDEMLTAKGLEYLGKHKKTAIFEGLVSPTVPFKYKVDYNLGDIVRCNGEYGLSQSMMVSEYVRVEDEEGDRGYPSLVIV